MGDKYRHGHAGIDPQRRLYPVSCQRGASPLGGSRQGDNHGRISPNTPASEGRPEVQGRLQEGCPEPLEKMTVHAPTDPRATNGVSGRRFKGDRDPIRSNQARPLHEGPILAGREVSLVFAKQSTATWDEDLTAIEPRDIA